MQNVYYYSRKTLHEYTSSSFQSGCYDVSEWVIYCPVFINTIQINAIFLNNMHVEAIRILETIE